MHFLELISEHKLQTGRIGLPRSIIGHVGHRINRKRENTADEAFGNSNDHMNTEKEPVPERFRVTSI
jgi:hypothetical protein